MFQDACRNVLKKLDGVNTINGVFSGEYQLSDAPNLGTWKITAAIADQVFLANVLAIIDFVGNLFYFGRLNRFSSLNTAEDSYG